MGRRGGRSPELKRETRPIFPPRQLLLGLIGLGAAIAAGALGYSSKEIYAGPHQICRGVSIAGIDVGELAPSEARIRLEAELSQRQTQMLQFTEGAHAFSASIGELGIAYDIPAAVAGAASLGHEGNLLRRSASRVSLRLRGATLPLPYALDTPRAKAWFASVAEKIDVEPQDARADWTGKEIRITGEKSGRKLDVDAVLRSLRGMCSKSALPARLTLPMHTVLPSISRKDLADIDTILSQYETTFNPRKRNRTHNMRLAVMSVDGRLIRPGETFSYNRCVGPRLEEYGYLPAPIFSDDEIIQGVGGGVCQVATTVYNAALFAGLKIVTRAHHSRPVAYAPRGRDATVYFGNTDLKFRNNTSKPIYLRAYTEGVRVICLLFGNKSQERNVTLRCVEDSEKPPDEVRIEDPQLPSGKEVVDEEGRPGYQVSFVREIRKSDSEMVRETISNDYYRPKAVKIRVGTGPSSETGKPEALGASGPSDQSVPGKSQAESVDSSGSLKPAPSRSASPSPATIRVEDLGRKTAEH